MGTWGSGNLESDGALDTVSHLSEKLISKIWQALQTPESWEADEHNHDKLFVKLEWVFALDKANLINVWDCPDPEEFDAVIKIWLKGWSEYFDGLSGPEFKAERLEVIQKSFSAFRTLCEKGNAMRSSFSNA